MLCCLKSDTYTTNEDRVLFQLADVPTESIINEREPSCSKQTVLLVGFLPIMEAFVSPFFNWLMCMATESINERESAPKQTEDETVQYFLLPIMEGSVSESIFLSVSHTHCLHPSFATCSLIVS